MSCSFVEGTSGRSEGVFSVIDSSSEAAVAVFSVIPVSLFAVISVSVFAVVPGSVCAVFSVCRFRVFHVSDVSVRR